MKAGQPTSLNVFESGIITHPEQTGNNYVEYTLNHNLGIQPFLTRMFALVSGDWVEQYDWATSGATYYGYYLQPSTDITNITKIRVLRIQSGNTDIKFRFYSNTSI